MWTAAKRLGKVLVITLAPCHRGDTRFWFVYSERRDERSKYVGYFENKLWQKIANGHWLMSPDSCCTFRSFFGFWFSSFSGDSCWQFCNSKTNPTPSKLLTSTHTLTLWRLQSLWSWSSWLERVIFPIEPCIITNICNANILYLHNKISLYFWSCKSNHITNSASFGLTQTWCHTRRIDFGSYWSSTLCKSNEVLTPCEIQTSQRFIKLGMPEYFQATFWTYLVCY